MLTGDAEASLLPGRAGRYERHARPCADEMLTNGMAVDLCSAGLRVLSVAPVEQHDVLPSNPRPPQVSPRGRVID